MTSSVSLPPGWVEARDPNSGRIYYANPSTGESSWEIPQNPNQSSIGVPDSAQGKSSNANNNQNHSAYARMIQAAREMTVQQAAASNDTFHQYSSNQPVGLELQSLTVGQVADLVQLMKRKAQDDKMKDSVISDAPEDDASSSPYISINPYSLPDQWDRAESIMNDDENLIESKIDTLLEQLQEFGYSKERHEDIMDYL